MLVFKAYELKKHKINKNINKQAKFINHAKQHCFFNTSNPYIENQQHNEANTEQAN